MKRQSLFILLIGLLLVVSCTKVEVEYSQSKNIGFAYTPHEGSVNLKFSDYISSVTYFVYDSSGKLHSTGSVQTTDKNNLSSAIQLELPQGEYHIVCWGNLEHFNQTEESQQLSSAWVGNIGSKSAQGVQSSDPLYYASATFTQSEGQVNSQDLELTFTNIHIPIRVYIRSFINENIPGYNQAPIIELTDFSVAFDFTGKPQTKLIAYYPKMIFDATTNLFSARCLVPRFDQQTGALLNIYSGDGKRQLLYSVSLKDYMAINDISIDDKQEVSVPILIEFYHNGISLSATVRKPDWKDVEVTPEW